MPDGAATAVLVRGRRHIGHARTSAGIGKPPGASGSGGGGGGTGKRFDGASAASAVPNHHSSTLKPSTAATRLGRAASTTPKHDCSSSTRSAPRRLLRAAATAACRAAAVRAAHACTSSRRARMSRVCRSVSSGLCVLAPPATYASLVAGCSGEPRRYTANKRETHPVTRLAPSAAACTQGYSAMKARSRRERSTPLDCASTATCTVRLSSAKHAQPRQCCAPATRPEVPCWQPRRRAAGRTLVPPWP